MKKIFNNVLLAVALATAGNAMAADYALAPLAVTAETGSTVDLQVVMTNNDLSITSFQFDLYLPEGVAVEKDSYGNIIATLSDRKEDHIISAAVQTDGAIRYASYSNNNLVYAGSDGVIMTTPIVVNAAPGSYEIMIKNAEIVSAGTFDMTHPAQATCTLTVTAAEEIRYGANQLYAKDITINEGENAVMQVCYNSETDVHEYSMEITLPTGVTVGEITYTEVLTLQNYDNSNSFADGVLKMEGVQTGTSKKPKPAKAGNQVIANVQLNTSSLVAGEYNIVVGAQYLSNENDENDGEYNPEAYTAKLTVVAGSSSWSLVDGEAYTNATSQSGVAVTYTRKFNNTEWQGLYLPFNMSYSEWSEFADVAEIHNIRGYEDANGQITEVTIECNRLIDGDELVPNVPYVIRAKQTGTVEFECTGKNLIAAPTTSTPLECSSTKMVYSFHGVYQETTGLYEQGAYRLTGGGFAQFASSAGKLDPYRFYMLITPKNGGYNPSAMPRKINLSVDGEDTTGVESVGVDLEEVGAYYDLMGRKVVNPSTGIYIHNGKKVYIK